MKFSSASGGAVSCILDLLPSRNPIAKTLGSYAPEYYSSSRVGMDAGYFTLVSLLFSAISISSSNIFRYYFILVNIKRGANQT